MFSKLAKSWWLVVAVFLTVAKLWLTRGQTIAAIGTAIHDDRLFLDLAAQLLRGEWLGPYDQFTLAKGPFYPLWIAGISLTGLPLRFAEQLAYVAACVLTLRALWPLLTTSHVRLATYALLLWNPMSFEGPTLTRLLRQNIYTPLALATFAGLIALILRRARPLRERLPWALLLGFAIGAFWLTREESVWILPGLAVLGAGLFIGLPRERSAWRSAVTSLGIATLAALLPLLVVSTMNYRHYGWFGTVEFRASEFKDAYGALVRIKSGPSLPKVPVTRQAREAAYAVSPAFAELQPYLEGPVGDQWADKELYPAAERQIRGGWFIWALRDAVREAGRANTAGEAMAFYRRVADEINRACDDGRLPAGPHRSGFLPVMYPGLGRELWSGAQEYAAYFATFRSFTAYPGDSIGDRASLKIFQDLTHDRLSATAQGETLQPVFARARVDQLHQLGILVASVVVFLVLAAHVVWPVRVIQALWLRRYSFPLLLATAAWTACATYLAVNVLVHVTSFPNITPSAMAAAYPLLILFVIAVGLDAFATWNSETVESRSTDALPETAWAARARWLWIGGATGLVFAIRLLESALFASDGPSGGPWSGAVAAALHAGFVFLLVRWLCASLDRFAVLGGTLLAIVLGAWPYAGETVAGGFQFQFPIVLLFLFLHVRDSFEFPPGSRRWWWAQAAGVAGLMALFGLALTPLAITVLAVAVWTNLPGRLTRYIPFLLAALGINVILILTIPPPRGFAPGAQSLPAFLHAWFSVLSWPAAWPAAAVAMNAPFFIFALQLRGRADAAPFDRIVLALGVWSGVQSATIAFAGTGELSDLVSRHGELLAVGALANGLALLRLLAASSPPWRPLAWTALLAWSCVFFHGLQSHSLPPAHASAWAGGAVRFVQALGLVSGLALAGGICASRFVPIPRLAWRTDPFRVWIVAGVGGAALLVLLQWHHPFEFDQNRRWELLVSPAGTHAGLHFEFVGQAPFPNDRLAGAATIQPESLRNHFFGTQPNGPGFTGVVRSDAFSIDSPWLVVPYAGFPVGDGNALRLQVEDAGGAMIADLWCPPPNPTDVAFWAVDVHAYQGRQARVWLYDGRTDSEEWVAAAPPIRARDAALAARLQRQLTLDRHGGCRPTLAWIVLLCALWLAGKGSAFIVQRWQAGRNPRAAPSAA